MNSNVTISRDELRMMAECLEEIQKHETHMMQCLERVAARLESVEESDARLENE